LPVHEVTALIEAKENVQSSGTILSQAGTTVFEEYTLLNVFPRDIADAHVSGALHVNSIGTWLLKPNEVMHDLRFFFQNGFKTISPFQHSGNQPQSFESALSVAFNALLHSTPEINEMQTLDHLNVFLAPYIKGTDLMVAKENLRSFILNLNQHTEATLALDLSLPKFVADKPAIGPQGTTNSKYGDFTAESQLIASLVVEIFSEESLLKPLLNPKLILKTTSEAFTDENKKAILLKAHSLAIEKGIPYFADMTQKEGNYTVFSGTGCKFEADLTGDWETDTLRTGCLGCVTINLPRIAQESEKEKNKFFEILKERCELASRALEIKARALKQHGRNLLPFLTQSANGDTYFRIENCSNIINLAGFQESVEIFCEKNITHEESKKFAEEIAQNIAAFKHKIGRKLGKRLFATILRSPEASARLVQLDIEKYGVGKVKFSGTREKPFYSTTKRLHPQTENFPSIPAELLEIDQNLRTLSAGANLSIIELETAEYKPEELLNLTKHLIETQAAEFFTYNRKITYCSNCRKSWVGTMHKCPSCGAMSTLITFDRFSST
jgi:ribonucleoside-triphosphate reductase